VEPLCRALDDPGFWVRLQAILALGKLGPKLVPAEKLRPLCDDPKEPVALDAATVLLIFGESDMEERLRQMLSDADYHLPKHFAAVAEKLRSPALTPLLLSLLDHEAAAARMRAAQAVGRLKLAEGADRLIGLLSDSDQPTRAAAAQALGELGDHRAVGELERLARTGTGQLRVASVGALGKFGSGAVLVTLRRALVDDDPTVRLAAVQALAHVKGEEAVLLLRSVYTDREEAASVRAHAAVSAARLDDYRAVVELNSEAQNEDYYVRVWAAWGLGEAAGRAQLFALVNLLADKDEMVRPVAAGALFKLSNRLEPAQSSGTSGSSFDVPQDGEPVEP
jgi:HEAT repeat protein